MRRRGNSRCYTYGQDRGVILKDEEFTPTEFEEDSKPKNVLTTYHCKMVILHPRELLLTYRYNSELSVLRAADRNISNLYVGFVKQVTDKSFDASMVFFMVPSDGGRYSYVSESYPVRYGGLRCYSRYRFVTV